MSRNQTWFKNKLLVLTLALVLTSCSKIEDGWRTLSIQVGKRHTSSLRDAFFEPGQTSSLFLPPSSIFAAPPTVSGFQCLAVNVVGPGIASSGNGPVDPQRFDNLLKRISYCGYPGILAGPIPTASQGEVFKLRVPVGPLRIAQMIGVEETTAAVCSNAVPIGSDNNNTTNYYEIGRAVFDLQSDRKIEIYGEYNSLTTTDQALRKVNCRDPYSQVIMSHPYLVAYWRLNDAVGSSIAADQKGGIGGLPLTSVTLQQTSGIFETGGSSASFDGVVSKAETAMGYNFVNGGFTFEAWVNITGSCSTTKPVLYMRDNAASHAIRLGCDFSSPNSVAAFQVINGSMANVLGAGYPINDSTWHHLVGTVDGANNVSLYVDGILRGSSVGAFSGGWNITGTPASTAIGFAVDGAMYFPGFIDEVAIYSVPLSASEIQSHYSRGKGL